MYGRKRKYSTFARRRYSRGRRYFRGRRSYRTSVRSYRKYRKSYSGSSTKVRGITQSDNLYVKLKDRYSVTVSATASTTQVFIFNANDVYDPVHALGGGQPAGFAQYSALYENFYVGGSKIRVVAQNSEGANNNVFILPTKFDTVGLGYQVLEAPMVKSRYLSNSSASSKSMAVLKSYQSTKRILSEPNPSNNPENWGTASSSPSKFWYWWIGYINDDESASHQIVCDVCVTYYVKFFNRQQLSSV